MSVLCDTVSKGYKNSKLFELCKTGSGTEKDLDI
jgi:hypothetical protein